MVAQLHSEPPKTNTLLEQYKCYVQDLGNIGSRHENTRRFYLSVVSAIMVFMSMAGATGPFSGVKWSVQILVGLVGIMICLAWTLHMQSFRALFRAKFKVVREMEDHLDFPPFRSEFDYLKKDNRFRRLTQIDSLMPIAFSLVFVGILALK